MKFTPCEYKVLVRPDKVDDVYAGKIIIPDIVRDKQQISQDKAEVLAVGGNAFEDWLGARPKVGDRVMINRHSGYQFYDNSDGKKVEYRVINDKDISLILEA
uniref:Putative chaperonin n=1 Tax=viral metagenome TaxID=1070528 RepID=A0A6M3JT23_9ZZZZ